MAVNTNQPPPQPAARGPACIQCGKCLSACPLVAATGREELSPKAKALLLTPGAAELTPARAAEVAKLCLGCGRCAAACPRGVSVPDMVARLRERFPGLAGRAVQAGVKRPGALWPVAARFFKGQSQGSLAPRHQPIRPWMRAESLTPCGAGRKAVLFSGCTATHAKPGWGATARRLLTGLGYGVAKAGFSCCGKPAAAAGSADAARGLALANVNAWRAAGRPLVAALCVSCARELTGYAGQDLGWTPGEADAWRAAVTPLSRLLAGSHFTVDQARAPGAVLYHRPCHTAAGPRGDPDHALLSRTLGKRLTYRGGDACCGFGGVLRATAPELCRHVADTAWAYHAAPGGSQLLTGCAACVLQLAATAPDGVAVAHWLDAVGI